VSLELRAADTFGPARLAALFTAAYEGYTVPIHIDEAALAFMVEAFDLDLGRSLVAVDDDNPVGLVLLGVRGAVGWIGGIGVVASARRRGLGLALMEGVLAQARNAGVAETRLEVIAENAGAIALYERLGFDRLRGLEVWSLDRPAPPSSATATTLAEAAAWIRTHRRAPEPWQRGDETLANLMRRRAEPQALVSGDAAAIYRVDGARVSLLQVAGGERGLHDVVAALRAKGVVSAVNYPAGGPVANVLSAAGADVVLRQLEMVIAL